MKKILFTSFAFSAVFLLLLNLTFGTYFEGYEPIINALFSGEFSSQMGFTFFVSTWFGLSAVISSLTHYFNSSFAYSWVCTGLNLLILTSFTSCFLLLIKHKVLTFRHAALIYVAFLFSFLESLVYVYNLRISFFSLLAAFFYFSAIQKFSLNKKNYVLVFILAFIGIYTRLEIAVITAFIFLMFSILFYRKTMLFSICIFIASLATFSFYKVYEHKVYPDCEVMLNVETEFGDKESISPDDYQDQATKLKLEAIGRYIEDDDVYGIKDIARFTSTKTMVEYLRSEKFPQIYRHKLLHLAGKLKNYLWLFLLTFCLTIFAGYIYVEGQSQWRLEILKMVALTAIIFLVILALNLVVICPHNLIVVILSAYGLVSIAYLSIHFYKSKSIKYFILAFLVAQTFFLGKYLYELHTLQVEKYAKAKVVRQLMVDLAEQQKQIVFANGTHEDNYPARLFSGLLEQRVTHYYADFFLSRYPFFRKHNELLFGSNYGKLKAKLITIADTQNNVVYFSNEKYNDFLKEYVRHFHGLELWFSPLETKVDLQDLKPYLVHIGKE